MPSIANGESGASVRAKLNTLLANANIATYTTRAALVSAWSDGLLDDGALVSDGTVMYKASAGATTISDLPGLVPHDPSGEYDAFVEHFATTSPTASINITAALQSAINYVGGLGGGTFGQGGKLGLKAREYTVSDLDADNYCVEVANSMTIEGAGPNSTGIYINSPNVTPFYVGKGDAAILADTNNTAIVDKVVFRGIQFYNVDADPPTNGQAVLCDRSVVEFHECRFINFYRGITFLGNPESCRVSNCDISAGSNAPAKLAYDGQTGNFTVGLTITGGTSGATATIVSDTDGGTTGTLRLSTVTGIFQNNETITDTSTGSATVNGTLTGETGSAGVYIGRRQVKSPTLNYDAQTAEFTVGATLTGGTSGATAVIRAITDDGTTGTLTLSNISGTFQNNETITDNNGSPGSATANGTVSQLVGAYQDTTDNLYYLEPNYVLIENCNIRMGATTSQYGGAYAVRVGAVDTLQITDCHLAWGYVASVGFIPEQANMSFTDVRIAGGLIDPLPGKSLYGVYAADTAGVTPTVVGSIQIADTSIAGPALDGVNWALPIRRFTMDTVDVKGTGRFGITINSATCRNASIQNCNIYDTNGDGGTAQAIYLDNCDRVRLIGNNIDAGYRGVQITANSGRVMLIGNQVNGMSDNISFFVPSGYTGELIEANNDIQESTSITATTRIRLPVGQDHFSITGASDIWEIRTDVNSSAYPNRVVWLTFDDASVLKDDGGTPPGAEVPNLRITADFTCAAGTVVGLKWDAGLSKWVIISTRANA